MRNELILDVGCGKTNRGTTGIDYDISSDADVIADAIHLPFKQTFGAVIMRHSLEHLANPTIALYEVHRVLRRGGSLTVAVPNIMKSSGILRWILRGRLSTAHRICWRFVELNNLLEMTGFTVLTHNLNTIVERLQEYSLIVKATRNHVMEKLSGARAHGCHCL